MIEKNSKILKNKSKDMDSNFLQQSLKSYWERRRDDSLMLAKLRDDTWNMLNMQHIIPNSKRWDFSDIVVAINKLKDPPTWLKVATTLENPSPTHNISVAYCKKYNNCSSGCSLKHKKRFAFSIISQYWDDAGSWNLPHRRQRHSCPSQLILWPQHPLTGKKSGKRRRF